MTYGRKPSNPQDKTHDAIGWTQVDVSPYVLELNKRTDIFTPATGERYRFEDSAGPPYSPDFQSVAVDHKFGGYVCGFVHAAIIYRSGPSICVELETVVSVRNTDRYAQIWTETAGKTNYAPFFTINLLVGGLAIGPMSTERRHPNGDAGLFHAYVKFGKVARGQQIHAETRVFRQTLSEDIAKIHAVQLISPHPSAVVTA